MEDSNDDDLGLERQKQELKSKEAWGKKKGQYYKKESDSEEESEGSGAEDLLKEAQRL